MQFDLMNAAQNGNITINSFYGLNRRHKADRAEFSDMMNMTSDKYPCLASVRSTPVIKTKLTGRAGFTYKACIAPRYEDTAIDTFTGILRFASAAGSTLRFCYNGEVIDFESEDMLLTDGCDFTLADFNGKIIICAYNAAENDSRMYYYDYTAASEGVVKHMEKGVYGADCKFYSAGDPDADYEVVNYIAADGVNWSETFKEGDAVFIENAAQSGGAGEVNLSLDIDSRFDNADKNRFISCIVQRIDGNKLYVQLYNYLAQAVTFKTDSNKYTSSPVKKDEGMVNVKIKMPVMNHVCVHSNRLWGTNPNGEYIYASKLSDPFNFSTYQGLSTDSYYAQIGTAGGFTGIVSYRDNLVAFKKDYIHHIYGDKPASYTIPKQLEGVGCIDIRSAVTVDTSLFFLGYNGFYEYTGGSPALISEKLDRRFLRAVGMTDGQKYIVSCNGADGMDELLVYDPKHAMWHKEAYIDAVGGMSRGGENYIVSETEGLMHLHGGEYGMFAAQSACIFADIMDFKAPNEMWIRAYIADGASLTVSTSEDGGDMIEHKTFTGGGMTVLRVPVRFINGDFFCYRVDGEGEVVIYDIEFVVPSGGRRYKEY